MIEKAVKEKPITLREKWDYDAESGVTIMPPKKRRPVERLVK